MAPSLLDTFRVLSSFEPPQGSLRGAPWEEYVDWAIAQGLAPAGGLQPGVPAGRGGRARVGPGSAALHLLGLRQRQRDEARQLQAIDRRSRGPQAAASWARAAFAEALYPHVGFRPVLDIQVLVRRVDVDGFSGYLSQHHFKPEKDESNSGAARVLSDGRTAHLPLRGRARARPARGAQGIFDRAQPMEGVRPVHLPARSWRTRCCSWSWSTRARATRCRGCPSWTCASW